MAAIGKINPVSQLFNGQGAIVVFDKPSDYTIAAIETLANPKNVGDVKLDSTTWSGDDVTENLIKNEQGYTVVSTIEAGTFGLEATLMDTSKAMLEKFMLSTELTGTFADTDYLKAGTKIHGFGTRATIIECPIMMLNATLDRAVMFPRAQITSSLVIEDKILCIKLKVTALSINTSELKTVMVLNGAANMA